MNDSSFTDRTGHTWSIAELLSSDIPRVTRWAEINSLIQDVLNDERWGPDGGTVREAIDRARNSAPLAWREVSADDDAPAAHADRIAAMVVAISEGWEPSPLVIGPDGGLWDGLHRLCALHLAGKNGVNVLDFNPQSEAGLWELGPDMMKQLETHLGDDPVNRQRWLAYKFQEAAGYPHCFIHGFLQPLLAEECAHALENLTWERHETDFFRQDEYVLSTTDATLPPSLQRLARFLLGESLSAYMRSVAAKPLLETPEAIIHCMKPGDYVGVHNDFRTEGERLRCVIYLGHKEADMRHGLFVALGDAQGHHVLDSHAPVHNSAVLFEISPQSFHVVTEIEEGVRYCVVLSYYEPAVPRTGRAQLIDDQTDCGLPTD